MHELGLLEEFLKLPHSRVERLSGQVGATTIMLADFSHAGYAIAVSSL